MASMRRDLPSGDVTFLFTDIEGSTKLLHELGAESYADALAEHRAILRNACARHGGVEVDNQGDAFFYAFPDAAEAVEAARQGRDALAASGRIRVRMGLHSGSPHLTTEGYVGRDVHKGARIAAAGHGGQVLLSKETRDIVVADVTDLGEHRLKDFDEPIWIFQLGAERHPPLKTISNTNLPRPASSFVGRAKEVDDVVSLLRAGARLVTLTGPGGSGKTRLGIEAAAELISEHRNGVFWVGLAPLRDPKLVVDEIANTIGAKGVLKEFVAEREMLLLLDNFEQVIEAASELPALLSACPNLRLLVTSREVLRVTGEVEYPVQPLAEVEAVALFCARSGLVPDQIIGDLCVRLDNLPLAVELAAARTRVLTPQEILERLASRLDVLKGGRDAEPRQATLRATIEWSYELLSDDERALFARVGVFRGGCTLDAAVEVAAADLDVLQGLVEKSLVRRTQDRFWMLETIREFAVERSQASGEAEALRWHHAHHFLALAEEAEPGLLAGAAAEWTPRLEREHDNLRAALDWLESTGETQDALRMAGSLVEFWGEHGHFVEGRRRLERALEADEAPTPARAKALDASGQMASAFGDIATARRRTEEAFELYRSLGNAWGVANARWMLGYLATEEDDLDVARRLLEETVSAFRDLGDDHAAMLSTRTLAWAHEKSGDLKTARALHQENLLRARAVGYAQVEAVTIGQLAMIALAEGRYTDSIELLKEQLPIHRRLGDVLESVVDLCRVASALAAVGRSEAAVTLVACTEALREELGAMWSWAAKLNAETLASVRMRLDERTFAEARERGRVMTHEDAITFALNALEAGVS